MIYNPSMNKYIKWVFWKVGASVPILVTIWMMISGRPLPYDGFEYVAYVMLWILGPVTLDFIAAAIKRNEKKCAWCSGYKITFISGKEGKWKWKYSNKDGSRDKRRKDNIEKATYTSEYKCEECNASTKFLHIESQSPGPNTNIIKRALLNNGKGERKGSDKRGINKWNTTMDKWNTTGEFWQYWAFVPFLLCGFSLIGLVIYFLNFIDDYKTIPAPGLFLLVGIAAVYTYWKILKGLFTGDDAYRHLKMLFFLFPILLLMGFFQPQLYIPFFM